VLSKNIPGVDATAEVTNASVDNLKLIGAGKADVALCLSDTASDGYKGIDFRELADVTPSELMRASAHVKERHHLAMSVGSIFSKPDSPRGA
jgi:TRAP-type uncharacterized transport system substrate-binding protein